MVFQIKIIISVSDFSHNLKKMQQGVAYKRESCFMYMILIELLGHCIV